MKTKTVYTSALKYAKRIRIVFDEYEDGNMYIGLYTMNGEPYADITTNLGDFLPFPYAYVEKDSEAEKFIQEQGMGMPCVLTGNAFKTYCMYYFNT